VKDNVSPSFHLPFTVTGITGKTSSSFSKDIIVFLKKTMMFPERDDDVFAKRSYEFLKRSNGF